MSTVTAATTSTGFTLSSVEAVRVVTAILAAAAKFV